MNKNILGKIYYGDNLTVLKKLKSNIVSLIYIDPPFNTGKKQSRKDKFYEDKNKWADRMIKKRVPVILRNIERLKNELNELEKELKALTTL